MRAQIIRAGAGIRWYLKQATGEAKWDDYLGRCRSEDSAPMTRRDFERQRTEHKEGNAASRCC